MPFIPRATSLAKITTALARSPVTALLGPRQCGKTTLARLIAADKGAAYFDLENPRDLARLDAPLVALEQLQGLVVFDEVQRKPELFELLRVLADRPGHSARFLLLGSASPDLIRGVSETLAGRIAFVDLSGFSLTEINAENFQQLWLRGGFPRSYLAEDDQASFAWRNDFIRTFLERDIPQLGITIPSAVLRRFWTMIAHYHGQIWNSADFARSLGSSEATARRYLDILSGSYMIRQLPPWHENLKKRQVKSPKVFIRDTGLLHALLSLETTADVNRHPKMGASWEGFAIEELIAAANSRDIYFWATHAGSELDLLLFNKGRRLGFEIKYADAPRTTKSMRIAKEDLQLDRLYIIYPGPECYDLDTDITVLPLQDIPLLFKEE